MAIFSCLPWRSKKSSTSASKPRTPPVLQTKIKYVPAKAKNTQSFAKRRLQKELQLANQNPPTHCSYGLVGEDIFKWQGTIVGPSDTPFEGGIFFLSIEFTDNYPFTPPNIRFQTKVYHPNISEDGTIDVDILGKQWSPALNTEKTLLSICSLLPEPNAEDLFNPVCTLYCTDMKSYKKKAREWTMKYAMY